LTVKKENIARRLWEGIKQDCERDFPYERSMKSKYLELSIPGFSRNSDNCLAFSGIFF
jgi:hypothetical protein